MAKTPIEIKNAMRDAGFDDGISDFLAEEFHSQKEENKKDFITQKDLEAFEIKILWKGFIVYSAAFITIVGLAKLIITAL